MSEFLNKCIPQRNICESFVSKKGAKLIFLMNKHRESHLFWISGKCIRLVKDDIYSIGVHMDWKMRPFKYSGGQLEPVLDEKGEQVEIDVVEWERTYQFLPDKYLNAKEDEMFKEMEEANKRDPRFTKESDRDDIAV